MKVVQLVLLLIVANVAFGQNYVKLTKEIASLRIEVESLNKEVEEARNSGTRELKGLSIQNAEVEATIRKEELTNKSLRDKLSELKLKLKKNDRGIAELRPIVVSGINKLSSYVSGAIPYKSTARLQNLSDLKRELENGEISSHLALSRLWSAYEDEDRLLRSSHLSRESIVLDGESYLADVAHVGSLVEMFSLEDGTYGITTKRDGVWTNQLLKNADEVNAAKNLFEGLKKQIKVAQYKLPIGVGEN